MNVKLLSPLLPVNCAINSVPVRTLILLVDKLATEALAPTVPVVPSTEIPVTPALIKVATPVLSSMMVMAPSAPPVKETTPALSDT